MSSQRKPSTYSSISTPILHSTICLPTLRATSFKRENTSAASSLNLAVSRDFSRHTRHETRATNIFSSTSLNMPLNMSSVVTSSSTEASSHATRPFVCTTPSALVWPRRLSTRRICFSSLRLINPAASFAALFASFRAMDSLRFSACASSWASNCSDSVIGCFFIIPFMVSIRLINLAKFSLSIFMSFSASRMGIPSGKRFKTSPTELIHLSLASRGCKSFGKYTRMLLITSSCSSGTRITLGSVSSASKSA
mmetsp:Transcript_3105/g.11230  ORF Transcript_3105/g.11230 Transcript_3105/m.11230 type:complete len:252 (+) Transcript_3105:279-1034(+)